jgi:hypothetical protein
MMQQTSSTEICAPCTPQQQATPNAAPASANVSIEDIIPFHHVATIVVIASIAILVLLLLIGWLSYRRQEPFVCICCIRRRVGYDSSPRTGKVRDMSTVKKSRNDLENALDSTCASMVSGISDTHTAKQQFLSMNESSNPDSLDGQEYLPPIGYSLYYADLVSEIRFDQDEALISRLRLHFNLQAALKQSRKSCVIMTLCPISPRTIALCIPPPDSAWKRQSLSSHRGLACKREIALQFTFNVLIGSLTSPIRWLPWIL